MIRFREYLIEHEEIYPRPVRRKLGLGWKFWVALTVAIAAIVLAALRTAHSFYTAATLSAAIYGLDSDFVTQFMSITEATAAMLAIEGGLVYGAVKRAQEHGKINPRLFVVYIGLLVAISIVAGFGQSLGLVVGLSEGVVAGFSWVMAVILGVGASIVAWLSGEMLGVELLKFELALASAEKSHQAALTKWTKEARNAWQEARKQPPVQEQVKEEPPAPEEPQATSERDKHKQRVADFVRSSALKHRRVPMPAEVGSALGISGRFAAQLMEELKAEA